MIVYNETLITTNFQVKPIIGLRDMESQSSQNSLKCHSFWSTNFYVCPI